MSAALIDLVSVGAQDVYITGDPQVSFFRQNYKRHTNFAIKPERLDYIGSFSSGSEVSIPIKSKGDLLSYIWIEATGINAKDNNTSIYNKNEVAFSQPTEFSLYIGGQEVSKIDTGFINSVHGALYNTTQAKASTWSGCDDAGENASANSYVIPFFFSEDWTKSLPLVGLQYHEVEIRIKCRNGTFSPGTTPKVYGSYIFLDTEEREFFSKTEHEILMTQTQFQPVNGSEKTIDLTYFNHPVKSIHIAAFGTGATYTFGVGGTASMFINGTPLFENMSLEYHRNVVPTRHCSYFPPGAKEEPIATWPFALTMDKSQPTGTLNFSRIDNAKITISDPNTTGAHFIRAYAVNYNILRIKNGMGGVAFGN